MHALRNLVIVLGDQLDHRLSALDEFDADRDAVWMAENEIEATYHWSHKKRLILFFSAMRHFRDALKHRDLRVIYHELQSSPACDLGRGFAEILGATLETYRPEKLVMTECGDYRVAEIFRDCADNHGLTLDVRPDRHFYCRLDEFDSWAEGRKKLVLENFYRFLRSREDILMEADGEPSGGAWNFDRRNRYSFGAEGANGLPPIPRFTTDKITDAVASVVERRFRNHPGQGRDFDLPVERRQAVQALDDFIAHRLPCFGPYQDALANGVDCAYHSRLSAALNLHLLTPGECIDKAVAAYRNENAPIESVEGFVRQILGWREFVRGVYWHYMPGYIERNALDVHLPVPRGYWDGETDMKCLGEALRNVLENSYAHHIQRLMVLGLFAQLAGVNPRAFHDWHMAMYGDAVDWASLPNALGMSQFGDGGIMGTKPYCASGNYIHRMSNHCSECRFDYRKAAGDGACPITTLYWDFLDRNASILEANHRMGFQLKNLRRKREDTALMTAIRNQARALRDRIQAGERV